MDLIDLRFGFGVTVTLLMLLVLVGFRHAASVFVRSGYSITAEVGMHMALAVFHILHITRTGWWDVIRPALGWSGHMPPVAPDGMGSAVNLGFIALGAAGSLFALWSLWQSIPASERAGYCWLTAPFYPWGAVRAYVER